MTPLAMVLKPSLHVEGVSLVLNGQRFTAKGVNFAFYYDENASVAIPAGQYTNRAAVASAMASAGINIVRIVYDHEFLVAQSSISQLLDVVQAFANAGIYSMPSDHYFTGMWPPLPDHTTAYPSFQGIVEGARFRGIEKYLVMNPYNENIYVTDYYPENMVANKDTLDFLRTTLGFRGAVVLAAGQWKPVAFQEMMDYDAALLGGSPNVIFSQHFYPNSAQATIDQFLNNADEFPLIAGEIGQFNGGETDPQFVIDILADLVQTSIPLGHNGAFAWIWSWALPNSMTDSDDYVTLLDYGTLWVSNYYGVSL